jgi:4-amino-4-deoxy-L-arabinose transferase-like glycosyltransferase
VAVSTSDAQSADRDEQADDEAREVEQTEEPTADVEQTDDPTADIEHTDEPTHEEANEEADEEADEVALSDDSASPPPGAPPHRPPLDRNHRLWLVGILAVALVLRLGWGLYALNEEPESWITGGDQYSYWYYGNEIADGNGYVSYITGEVSAYYPVGYPAMLATLFWVQEHTPVPDHQPTGVAVLHALMSTATVLFVFLIARALSGPRRALVAAGLTALTANLVLYVASYTLEPAFMFLLTAALAVLVTHDWANGPPGRGRLLAFGAVLGLSVVVRPFSLPLLLALGVGIVMVKGGWRRAVGSVALATVPIVLLVTPWAIRNYQAMDAFVPFSTNLGDTACMDRSLESTGHFAWATHDGCADPYLPEAERNRENIKKALSFVVEHPGEEVRLMGRRLAIMVEHSHSGLEETEALHGQFLGDRTRQAVVTTADVTFWVTLAAAAVGLVTALARRGDPDTRVQRWSVAFILVVLFALPIGLWGNPRFHVPVLPLLAIAAVTIPFPGRRARAEVDQGPADPPDDPPDDRPDDPPDEGADDRRDDSDEPATSGVTS